jgi:hypothetical protein
MRWLLGCVDYRLVSNSLLLYTAGYGVQWKKFGDGESHMASLLREEGMMGSFDRNESMIGLQG